MAVGNFTLYNTVGVICFEQEIFGQTKVNLLRPSYTPSLAHSTWADLSATQIADAGYAPVVLTGKTSVLSAGKVLWDCADINFGSNVTLTAKYVAIVKRAAGALAVTDRIIGYCDLNDTSGSATVGSINSTFQVNTPNGLFEV